MDSSISRNFCFLDTDGEEQGSDAERRREERRKKKEERLEKAKRRAERGEKRERKTKTKSKKMTKLPGQPKRAMSAYFLWMNANRENIKKDHPGLSVTEFGKKAGEIWKEMSDKSVRCNF